MSHQDGISLSGQTSGLPVNLTRHVMYISDQAMNRFSLCVFAFWACHVIFNILTGQTRDLTELAQHVH